MIKTEVINVSIYICLHHDHSENKFIQNKIKMKLINSTKIGRVAIFVGLKD